MDKSVSDMNEFEKVSDEKLISYKAPELKVYGTVSALTASGSTFRTECGTNNGASHVRC